MRETAGRGPQEVLEPAGQVSLVVEADVDSLADCSHALSNAQTRRVDDVRALNTARHKAWRIATCGTRKSPAAPHRQGDWHNTTMPVEEFVYMPGGRIWAQAAGDGPAVVLVHAGIADARMWDPEWTTPATNHHVVRHETRGFGPTERRDVPFSNRADLGALTGPRS